MPLARLLEGYDLSAAHTLLSLLGVFVALYLMQLKSREEDHLDPPWIGWGHRLSMAALALAFLWSVLFSMARAWQPWPPMLFIYAAIIGMMLFRIVTIRYRLARETRWRERESDEIRRYPRLSAVSGQDR